MKRFAVRCHATVHFNNGKRLSYSPQKQMAVTSYFLKKKKIPVSSALWGGLTAVSERRCETMFNETRTNKAAADSWLSLGACTRLFPFFLT